METGAINIRLLASNVVVAEGLGRAGGDVPDGNIPTSKPAPAALTNRGEAAQPPSLPSISLKQGMAERSDSAVLPGALADALVSEATEGIGQQADEEQGARPTNEEVLTQESYRAFLAVDDYENVVVRVVDSEGEEVRQIPPEEFLKMMEAMKEQVGNLFYRGA